MVSRGVCTTYSGCQAFLERRMDIFAVVFRTRDVVGDLRRAGQVYGGVAGNCTHTVIK
jgi:hypothetical protein